MFDTGNAGADVMRQIRAEYLEMPGLCLTLAQAQRLWNLPCTHCCCAFLEELADTGFLRQTTDGRFVRFHADSPRTSVGVSSIL